MSDTAGDDRPTVRSVMRALNLLGDLDLHGRTLTELSNKSEIAVPTALRLLRALEQGGYVEHLSDGRYVPGPNVIRLAHLVDPQGPVRWRVHEMLLRLHARIDESSAFFVREGDSRVCLDAIEANAPLRRIVAPGTRFPTHLGAAGKVILAFGSQANEIDLIPAKRDRYVAADGRSRSLTELGNELTEIRQSGYAVSYGEAAADFGGVSVPVHFGDVFIGAVAIAVPLVRFTESTVDQLALICCEEAAKVRTDTSSNLSDLRNLA